MDRPRPRAVELAEFRQGLREPSTFSGGAATADDLVRRWAAAVATQDTAMLRRLVIDRADFAWLVYPSSPMGQPPYDLSPALMWFQQEGNSGKGLTDVLRKRGGEALHLVGWSCNASEQQGENQVHAGCRVRRVAAPGDTVTEQLFGAIIERGGRFKFLSYSSRL